MSEHTELSFQHLQHSFQLNIKLQFGKRTTIQSHVALILNLHTNKIKSNNENKSNGLGSKFIFYLYSSARITIEMVRVLVIAQIREQMSGPEIS